MRLTALPAFEDNYVWALAADDGTAVVVDPGQAGPVLEAAARGLEPAAILVTHHHGDHVGGVRDLLDRWPHLPVFAPRDERLDFPYRAVADGEAVDVAGRAFRVIEVPGHTRTHVAYFGEGVLFSGDTLFSLGCGRMFEGTPSQMLASLKRLAALPGTTQVCCGHEYTLSNARFALQVDPSNAALQRRQQEAQAMRHAARPTLPISLESELATNPFLRTQAAEIRHAVAGRLGREPRDEVEVFAELRRWKDDFRA
ncbi:MAG: hydroxyacylglutathione hydrolase [Gammaproteobacteria bacterium]